MGPELAMALLTVFFYSWNSRRRNKINGNSIVEPLTSLPFCSNTLLNSCTNEIFGMGRNLKGNTSSNYDTNKQQHEHQSLSASIFERAMAMLRLHNFLKSSSKNSSELRWQDIFFHNEILGYIIGASGGKVNRSETRVQRLNQMWTSSRHILGYRSFLKTETVYSMQWPLAFLSI